MADSVLDADQIARARALLTPRPPRDSMWAPLGAAAALAVCGIAFAVAMVVAPPVKTEHVAPWRGVN